MPNRLANATSPYLLQHKDNPVDWWEWSPEAFAEARERNVPVLLSVGYAACHWCHVMAHESFEDEATAAYLNEHYVSVKVDREERPDVDAVYMQATVAMTGQGGWPMTCVLDHEGSPFFAGTYFPDQPRHGQPSFTQLLTAIDDAWTNRSDEVSASATRIKEALTRSVELSGGVAFDQAALDAAVTTLQRDFDAEWGGFGTAPKFPPSMVLEFLLRVPATSAAGDTAMRMAGKSLAAMAAGGIHDQLAGGFARYGVDRAWVVPHFEKMLYDNAQLLSVYAHWASRYDDAQAGEVALGIARFLLTELLTDEGAFASALDADSEGEEGTFYVWTPAQLVEVLGPDDGAWAASLLTVTEGGTFEKGSSTLQLLEQPDDPARWESVRARLLAARTDRVRPDRDDKVVAAWNGLAITGLVEAGTLLGEAELVEAAVRCGEFLAGVTCGPVGSSESPATAWRGRTRACSRTTAPWRAVSSPWRAPPATACGSAAQASCSTSCSSASPRRTAASTTLPTTPKYCSPGRATRLTRLPERSLGGAQRTRLVRRAHRLRPAPRRRRASPARHPAGRRLLAALRRLGPRRGADRPRWSVGGGDRRPRGSRA